MKKLTLFAFVLILPLSLTLSQKTYQAVNDISLTFTGSDGTNASAVIWNSDRKIYYAVIAGNADYPLEAFTKKGKTLHSSMAGIDVRGMWYNSKTKCLEGNGAGETGIFSIALDAVGKPQKPEVLFSGQLQPDFQSIGAFDDKNQLIYYFYDGIIYTYNRENGEAGEIIELEDFPGDLENINLTTVIFTDRKGEELGILDIEGKVYLFDLNGTHKATVQLPEDAITNDFFRFSFANERIWLYDVDSRTWKGYVVK